MNFKFDDGIKDINCFNGLFHLFAFNFQNSPVLMKKQSTYCIQLMQSALSNAICTEFTNAFRKVKR